MRTLSYRVLGVIFVTILFSCNFRRSQIAELKLVPVFNGKEYQYVDRNGNIIINPQFSIATVFRDGLALVKTSNDNPKWGFISEDGKYVINAIYKRATVFSEGLAWVVSDDGPPTLINSKGAFQATLQNAESVRIFKEGLAAFSVIDTSGTVKWGFVDKSGQIKITPQFTEVSNFSDGRCAVQNSKLKWGYIDDQGKIVINYQFDQASDFQNENAAVCLDRKFGLINADGKYVINPQFTTLQNDGNLFLINQDGKFGWCDKAGKLVINPQFDQAFPFNSNDLAPVKMGKNYGYVDKSGKIAINPQFDLAFPFNGSIGLVQSGSKIGFIDNAGRFIINPQFEVQNNEDLLNYLFNGESYYNGIETDFFNITPIVTNINIVSPEGLTLSSKFSDIVTKLQISQNSFNQYSNSSQVIYNRKITNDASLSFYVIGNAYRDVPNGWYMRKEFNNNGVVQGYAYLITLTGKGSGKAKQVKDQIEKTFQGFKLDSVQSNGLTVNTFTKLKKVVKTYYRGDQIVIMISGQDSQIPGEIDQVTYYNNYGNDSSLARSRMYDTTPKAVDTTRH